MTTHSKTAMGATLLFAVLVASGCHRPRITPVVPTLAFAIGEPVTILQRSTGIAPPPGPEVVRRQFGALTTVARAFLTPANVPRGTRLRFDLFDNLSVTAVVEYAEAYRDGGVTLIAIGETHPGHIALSYDAGQLVVFLSLPIEGDIEVVPFSADQLLVSQKPKQLRVACKASGLERRGKPQSPPPAATSASPSQIDVGVMYTGAALCSLRPGGQCPDEDFLRVTLSAWAMDSSTYLACSGIGARVNVVAVKKLAYDETGYLKTDLERFSTLGTSPGTDVADFRDVNDADVVLVLVDHGDEYGLANIFTTSYTVDQFKPLATGVAVAKVAFGYVLLHELAHTMGAGHQKGKGNGRYSYSHGNVIPDGYSDSYTVMAKGQGTRLPFFAGPKVPLDNGYTGSSSKDNVRTINETRALVEGFQTSNRPPLPAVPCAGALYSVQASRGKTASRPASR